MARTKPAEPEQTDSVANDTPETTPPPAETPAQRSDASPEPAAKYVKLNREGIHVFPDMGIQLQQGVVYEVVPADAPKLDPKKQIRADNVRILLAGQAVAYCDAAGN